MTEIKTKPSNQKFEDFFNEFVPDEQKRNDSIELINIMKSIINEDPKIWGSSIIGFGNYFYKSKRSSQKGNWFYIGFSPRKSAISLYVNMGQETSLLKNLGKFKMGKSCIYIKKLSDINIPVLIEIMKENINFIKNNDKFEIIEDK
ncbi:MAG TPA: DUF1801 domain-containing protein [Bacteroidales bacterium]|jgi:hypothetical protein|nr:DUF1801 domain-containing protein [Bacteroidales bacterium]